MKRRPKYTGKITTVDDAAMADMLVVVECTRCRHRRNMYAWKLASANERAPDLPLGVPMPGFYCRWCHRPVEAIVRTDGQFAG